MKPDRGLRRNSVSLALIGVSTMRLPIGSVPASAPVSVRNSPVAIVAQATRKDRGLRRLFAMGDDVRHRRMILGEPIGGTETIGDLCAGERELRAGQAEWRGVVERRWSGGLSWWSRCGRRRRR